MNEQLARRLIVFALVVAWAMPGIAQQPGDVYKWDFNEGTGGIVTDNSGVFKASLGVLPAEDSAPLTSIDAPSGKAGDRSLAAKGGLYVDDSNNSILDIIHGPITVEAWFKLEAMNQFQDILSYGDTYKIGINNGYLVWTFRTIEDTMSTTAIAMDGAWHHVAMAWEPGVGVTFFYDGQEADYQATTSQFRAPVAPWLFIGSGYNGGSPFPGILDRVRVHHALLDATQIDSDAANAKAPLASTLVSFDFNETALPVKSNANGVEREGISATEHTRITTAPKFSALSPTGNAGDYSLYFDGGDRVVFVDDQDIMQFIDEDFTFEAWLKFNPEEQISTRPILFAYGIGGQNGYSFSFRNAVMPRSDANSPSGKAGDNALKANSGLTVDDSNNPVFDVKEGPVTVEVWAKTGNVTGAQDFIRYGNAFKAGFNAGNLQLTFLGIQDVNSGAYLPADNQWHHIAYVWAPGTGVTFYLDGVEVANVATANTNRDLQNNSLAIGSSHTGSSPFLGSIDRLRIHKAVLTASELDSNAANPKAALASTLAAYHFDEAGAPYANAVNANRPAVNRAVGSTISVTTYGIIDQHSEVVIPDDGKWHHVAAAHEMDKEFRFFIDGKLGQSIPYLGGVRFANVYEFLVGAEAGGGNPYVGYMDRIRITRGALNEGELDYFVPVSIENWSLFE